MFFHPPTVIKECTFLEGESYMPKYKVSKKSWRRQCFISSRQQIQASLCPYQPVYVDYIAGYKTVKNCKKYAENDQTGKKCVLSASSTFASWWIFSLTLVLVSIPVANSTWRQRERGKKSHVYFLQINYRVIGTDIRHRWGFCIFLNMHSIM